MTAPEDNKVKNLRETRKEMAEARRSNVTPLSAANSAKKAAAAKKAPAKKAPAKKAAAKAVAKQRVANRPEKKMRWVRTSEPDAKGRYNQTGTCGNREYVITGDGDYWSCVLQIDGKAQKPMLAERVSYSGVYRKALDDLNGREGGVIPPVRNAENPWYGKSSYAAKDGEQLYEAQGASGQISVQSFDTVMTHAVSLANPSARNDVEKNGKIHAFHRSLEDAQKSAERLTKDGQTAVAVPAIPYRGQGEGDE
jgi:hypothetical protein